MHCSAPPCCRACEVGVKVEMQCFEIQLELGKLSKFSSMSYVGGHSQCQCHAEFRLLESSSPVPPSPRH